MKKCSKCKKTKRHTAFSYTKKGKKFSSQCKLCIKKYKLKLNHNITYKTFLNLLKSQNYKCSICASKISRTKIQKNQAMVDHCHNTDKIRGLLCISCNLALGWVKDSKETLFNLIKYIKEHNEQ